MNYKEFLKKKEIKSIDVGFDVDISELSPILFDFQKDIVKWSLKKGKSACFALTGLGKTLLELEFGKQVIKKEKGKILLIAPLAVTHQTIRMAIDKMCFCDNEIRFCHDSNDIKEGINVTNYEKLDNFNSKDFIGVILDESSILKSFSGKIRNKIINMFKETHYKLACTATPSPNDYMELGNHAEFLDIMKRNEMLSMFFIHDSGRTSQWRLKGYAQDKFWEWISSWAVVVNKPSDLGYNDDNFILPKLNIKDIIIENNVKSEDYLFSGVKRIGLKDVQKLARETIEEKVREIANIVNNDKDNIYVIWCNRNDESSQLSKAIIGSIEITGSHNDIYKEKKILEFSEGKIRVLITKPKIAGFGLNWQVCYNQVYFPNFSYEKYFQAVRRCWRFGQKREVTVCRIVTNEEIDIINVLNKKEREMKQMMLNMSKNTKDYVKGNIKEEKKDKNEYNPNQVIKSPNFLDFNNNGSINVYNQEINKNYAVYQGDCIEVVKSIPDNSIDFSIFSPPFSSLYVYSNNIRDLGNNKNHSNFYEQFSFLVKELYRITKEGRLLSFHCANIPYMKEKNGFIGMHDFRGELIRLFCKEEWIYHSEVTIWKNPVIEMQRTKALGLLHRQLKKDSSMCRMGNPDYIVTMRKKGENKEFIEHNNNNFPVSLWQDWASPVWMDIKQGNTLNKEKSEKDEKHICPLQLGTIERCIKLWSNENNIVFSPFAGIGSEIYQSVLMNRKGIGIELKKEYFEQMCNNLETADLKRKEINNVMF